jgi:rhodanese-related sulfurtransferase
LGAQVIGKDGVDKRIDILSSVIQRGSTIYELAEFEHAYAPPYSSAKDPVNMAGFVAENMLQKKLFVVPWTAANTLSENDVLIDVREPYEFTEAHMPGAINIPVDELRGRLDELDRDKTIYIYCQIGLRGYLAQRILLQNGFKKLFNIAGGFKLWSACNAEYLLSNQELAVV